MELPHMFCTDAAFTAYFVHKSYHKLHDVSTDLGHFLLIKATLCIQRVTFCNTEGEIMGPLDSAYITEGEIVEPLDSV